MSTDGRFAVDCGGAASRLRECDASVGCWRGGHGARHIIRQKEPKHGGVSSHKLRVTTTQIEEAFDKYDGDRDHVLNETELATMIRNKRPTLEPSAAAELVEQIWETYSQTDEDGGAR